MNHFRLVTQTYAQSSDPTPTPDPGAKLDFQLADPHSLELFNQSLNPGFWQSGDNLIGNLLSAALPIAIILAGLLLLINFLMAGFSIITNPTNPQAQEAGKGQIITSLTGFLLIFVAYWLIQALEIIFKLQLI